MAMTAHILYKNIDNKWPITQSKLANLFIRKDLNYKGILISDDIEMLALSGSIKSKINKWFGKIPYRQIKPRNYLAEPPSLIKRHLQVKRNVPSNCILIAFHMSGRKSKSFYTANLISRLLSKGFSSRLYQALVIKEKIFTKIETFLGEDIDPSLFYIKGLLSDGINYSIAHKKINKELDILCKNNVSEIELNGAIKKYNRKIAIEIGLSAEDILKLGL